MVFVHILAKIILTVSPLSSFYFSSSAFLLHQIRTIHQIMGCHVVAMPYPGRGHINPMMNLCNLLVSRKDNILISFVVTEEWLGFLSSETKPAQIRCATIPNVIPSEIGRGADFAGFVEATRTKLEDPFERLLDRLEPPRPSIIIYDISLPWVVGVGERWNIPVAALWTLPASVFSVYHHFELLLQNGHFPANVSGPFENCRFFFFFFFLNLRIKLKILDSVP
ncbi:UDP-glycosyltransferase 87A2 [Camellia lanceoleosa]|uniref:UDP-glycosyltransferase 87A2 n=1 Tax=Camellia lanceoleosa TaxID=1840588 RepID=A0ACC0HQH6_9ERIC|nr:UDP-glycosyltransferase 87A2 [Camellia lanceoleosa]